MSPARLPNRAMKKEITIPAPREEVWRVLSTTEGAQSFFAPRANIRVELAGPYELFFDESLPVGSQGTEGMTVLSYLPERMVSFEWIAPLEFRELRAQKTWVVVYLDDGDEGQTVVRLAHLGWRVGAEWDRLFDYFLRAWDIVLGRLERRFTHGPVDWQRPYYPPEKPKN
ncbi:MAG: SRPBCC domain-containing protein [Myxococcota bacterium]|nr:SRPBCC domain-containing protein [Myxococcota bacterium]